MLDINDVIHLILALSIFTILIIFVSTITIRSRQNKSAKVLKELSLSVEELKGLAASISEKQLVNETAINEISELLSSKSDNNKDEPVVVEIIEEPIVSNEQKNVAPENTNSRAIELASKIADYARQIDQLNDIEDAQVRDLKKQLLIFELQEIKREIALIES